VADSARQDVEAIADSLADGTSTLAEGLQASTDKALQGRWSELFQDALDATAAASSSMMPKLLSALVVLLLFYALYRLLAMILRRVLHRSHRVDDSLQNLTMRTFQMAAFAFIGITVLGQFGINVTALLAGLSIAGLAVGLAAKDTLENFIAGITIFVDKPFRIGDSIEVAETYGFVVQISMRSTRIRTLNNEIMVMPNVMMINQKLINHTMLGTLRVDVPFGIAYKEYPQQAREVVLKITGGDERLSTEFPPRVMVTQLGNSSVDMVLFLYLRDPALEVPIRMEYVEKVREALREAGIEIPFPHLQLFMDEAKAFAPGGVPGPTKALPERSGQ